MAITIGGKVYRNLQEQVLKNQNDIANIQRGAVEVEDATLSGTTHAENIIVVGDTVLDNTEVQGTLTIQEPVSDDDASTKLYVDESKGIVTPEQFGAKGDGETDDTTAFQSAIDSGKIVILKNSYVCGTITPTKDVKIIGNGNTIKLKSCDETSTKRHAPFIKSLTGDYNIEVIGIHFVSPSGSDTPATTQLNQSVIDIIGARKVLVKDCFFDNLSSHGETVPTESYNRRGVSITTVDTPYTEVCGCTFIGIRGEENVCTYMTASTDPYLIKCSIHDNMFGIDEDNKFNSTYNATSAITVLCGYADIYNNTYWIDYTGSTVNCFARVLNVYNEDFHGNASTSTIYDTCEETYFHFDNATFRNITVDIDTAVYYIFSLCGTNCSIDNVKLGTVQPLKAFVRWYYHNSKSNLYDSPLNENWDAGDINSSISNSTIYGKVNPLIYYYNSSWAPNSMNETISNCVIKNTTEESSTMLINPGKMYLRLINNEIYTHRISTITTGTSGVIGFYNKPVFETSYLLEGNKFIADTNTAANPIYFIWQHPHIEDNMISSFQAINNIIFSTHTNNDLVKGLQPTLGYSAGNINFTELS